MKRGLILGLILLAGVFGAEPVFAGVNDFYFSDFTGDYYLSRDAEGVSHLRVEEAVTAVFPDFNQNKGICRQIPFTNQGGKNITLSDLSRNNLMLTRNGKPEPIYSITKENDYFNVCTGTEEYVKGEQTYVFEYEFEKVVTDFGKHQELYWDTNGNGATQRFDMVTARVYVDEGILADLTGEAWCYVGKYGESGQDRCKITKTDDGFMFRAEDLARHEGLTFDIEIRSGTFSVPQPEKKYTFVRYVSVMAVICAVVILLSWAWYVKHREKRGHYKALFVKPEYQPNKQYGLTEMAEIYIGKKKDIKVPMLLEMIVRREIELVKGEDKKWRILVKKEVEGEYMNLLEILNGGLKPKVGSEVELKVRVATSSLITIKGVMEKKIVNRMKEDGLVEKKYQFGSRGMGWYGMIMEALGLGGFATLPAIFVYDNISESGMYGYDYVFEGGFLPMVFAMGFVAALIWLYLSNEIHKYENWTIEGLKASRYMDGLKLYIEMAEAERMKMLQSVKGVDTSPAGVVKLYEKLLPYAAVFGLEKSWMEEMQRYCEVEEVAEPDYLMTGFAVSEISRALTRASSYASTATTMASSGGGSSSGFSGGGGGGFSGGGGGGGGFSGR